MNFTFQSRIFVYLLLLLGLFVVSQATIYTVVEWTHHHQTNPDGSFHEGLQEVAEGVGMTLLLVPFLGGVAWILSRRMIGPLRTVADTAKRIRKGHWEERIETATM
ncbi:MAG: hypothetical protein RBT03_06885, partial [Kiritimatiellia bacterium]|nr:hypothetical protein [Kiritimatiellia bacterium]